MTNRQLLKECFQGLPVDTYTDDQLKPLMETEYFKRYVFAYHLKNNTVVAWLGWKIHVLRNLPSIMIEKIKTKYYALRSGFIR